MRLRNAVLSAVSALALALAVPGSAAAADGRHHQLHRLAGERAAAPAALLVDGSGLTRVNSYEPRDNRVIG